MKAYVAALALIIIAAAGMIAGCSSLGGGEATPVPTDAPPHFSIGGISGSQFFQGDEVAVNVTVEDDEPLHQTFIPTNVTQPVASGNDTNSNETVTVVPTAIVKLVNFTDTEPVTGELTRGNSTDLTRNCDVTLSNFNNTNITLDFGKVPAGSYKLTVTTPGDDPSTTASAGITVYPQPYIGQWVQVDTVAFLLENLEHDNVSLSIRNTGTRNVTFGTGQYQIFVNTSPGGETQLQGLNNTTVQPGQTLTVQAMIPINGDYYLDHFSIAAPGRKDNVQIPVQYEIKIAE